MKTNAARLLDTLGISYELLLYEVDPDDLSAPSVARKLNLPPEQVWKTLLCELQTGQKSAKTHAFAVLPGADELDLKQLARVAGARSATLAPLKQVETLTGYIRGGVTVLEAKHPFPAYADETLELYDRISVSAGRRGIQLFLAPADYLRASGAILAPLTQPA